MKETKDLLKRWMQFAREDLTVAKQILKSEFPVYRAVCFQCQQSAEKYLKAYQILYEIRIIKTHNLVAIIDTLIDFDKNIEQFKVKSKDISNYAVAYRYPDDFEDITKQQVEDSIFLATEIEKYITEKIVL
ncbi:MAG: HEPN domain-containing protein [Ferruginibacter sp.]|nr:HEPN domain-containing protein [Ferruginibacter sp.]